MNIRFLNIAFAMAVPLLLASCSQDDELTGDRLPEGKYPLEIASATISVEGGEAQPWGADAPQTRMGESKDGNNTSFERNDTINVSFSGGTPGKYYMYDIRGYFKAETPAYWPSKTKEETITAWYPTYEGEFGTVNLADQSKEFAYVMQAATTANFNDPVHLSFSHQLARVRILPTGEGGKDLDKVEIYTYTTCTHHQGTVSTDGAQEGWISMMYEDYNNIGKCWDANVVPGHKITKIRVNGIEGTTSLMPDKAGTIYKINIEVSLTKPTEITGGTTITEPGSYIVKGTLDKPVTIDCAEKVRLTLEKVTANMSEAPIVIKQGNATIDMKGTNIFNLTGTTGAISLAGEDANLKLQGKGDNPKLTITYSGNPTVNDAVIGATENTTVGDIFIKNLELSINGGEGTYRGAFIGAGSDATVGKMTIYMWWEDMSPKDFKARLTGTQVDNAEPVGKGAGNSSCGKVKWYRSDGTQIPI